MLSLPRLLQWRFRSLTKIILMRPVVAANGNRNRFVCHRLQAEPAEGQIEGISQCLIKACCHIQMTDSEAHGRNRNAAESMLLAAL